MEKRRPEKGEAPVIGPTEASVKTTLSIKQKELSMADSTQQNATRAITVPFHGAELYVVEHNGQPFTPMKPIVDGMGLDWKSQHRKVAANQGRWGMAIITMPMQGGVSVSETPGDLHGQLDHAGQRRAVTCIPVRKVAAWLATVEPGKVKNPDVRARVVMYQNECDDALWNYWNDGIATNPRMAYSVLPDQTISDKQAETLRLLLTENVKKLPKEKQGGAMVKGWSKLKAHFKTDYRHIPAVEFHEAVNILARHVAEWEVVDEAPKDALLTDTIERLARQLTTGNGAPVELFMPLYEAICAKLARRGMVLLRPGQIVVDSQKLAAVWFDLGKLRNRIDGLGVMESDLPPSWWAQNAITTA